ncbi:electron transfer flavoprotein subunit alpha/FixB family protein [Brevibacillus fluminis]|uniref:Electron transfer flavoprotein subunit alpha/FixB family protein n=1 Tax=Brevibacillus fluminis TaxID=511487 RepID=A0A3M8CZD7_9BACL|nr:electron transfer flavoprotein subunit alpha/FixB family protein [Brevibacillus fluminis]RNB81196.1 electron transfer flavoprotein subunit alpha/FixB family protein [Brevibacillus fluminis]
METILAVAEAKDGNVRKISYEVLTAARSMSSGGQIVAILLGSDSHEHADSLGEYGAKTVYLVNTQNEVGDTSVLFAEALQQLIEQIRPNAILMPHTALGKDVAPRVAARHGLGLVSDVIDIQIVDGEVVFTRPIYAGKAFEKRKMTSGLPFATIRPNNIRPERTTHTEVNKVDLKVHRKDLRTVVKEVVRKTTSTVDLTEAKVVVSGGRGVKSSEGFKLLQELADLLGGAVGASRGACDAEYCDYSLQIGQTGKVITPDLYIAAGISGAIQHVAGMSNSKVIIAINKDPEAPIFQIADYGIVGDLFEVIPMLTEELKQTLTI